MKSYSRHFVLLAILVAGCSAGAAAGNGAGRPLVDAGATGDSGKKGDGGTTTTVEPDASTEEEADASATDASKSDATSTDASVTDATSSTDSATTDASATDSAVTDAPVDAPKDAPADTSDAGKICHVDDGTWVATGLIAEYDIIANGKIWAIDEDGLLLGSVLLSSLPGMANGPCSGQVGTCHIDAATWRDDLDEYHIVHGGKLWRVDINGTAIANQTLRSIPGIAAGPCSGKTDAQCTFEAGAWRGDLEVYHLVSDGKIWEIAKDGTNNGSRNLTSLPGVASGPCAGVVGTCHVDAFTYRPDKSEYHVIANGNLYVLDKDGNAKGSGVSLMSIAGMAAGPCK